MGHHAGVDEPPGRDWVTRALEAAGCVAADDEAVELLAAAQGPDELRRMVDRRRAGEPLPWITGTTSFCGLTVRVDPGVYVPRWQSEPLARRAADLLPDDGAAVDLCTGSGAIALVLRAAHPTSRVIATELDPGAVACARRNGVDVLEGSLDGPLPAALAGSVDVLVGVLPYVPEEALHLLPRDVRAFEPGLALDGGPGGLTLVAEVVARSPRWVRPGGWLLLEVGSDQVATTDALLAAAGYVGIEVVEDGDGDPRGVAARLGG
jgi:release factor glutamine methyltransferase